MSRQFQLRGLLILVVFLFSLLFLTPSLVQKLPGWWGSIMPQDKIHLGLDLQGGMHLVLEVQSDAALNTTAEKRAEDLKRTLREKKIPLVSVSRPGNKAIIEAVFLKKEYADALTGVVNNEYPELEVTGTRSDGPRFYVTMDIKAKEAERIRKDAVDQALQTIRNRIDQFGVSEPEIRPQGHNRILVQLPGVTDAERAKKLIGRTAQLEFKLVDEEGDVSKAVATGVIPPGDQLLYEDIVDKETGRVTKRPYLIKKRTLLTGNYITEARVQIDQQFSEPYVLISFDRQGAKAFERITAANVNRRLAIILDDKVNTAPVIQEKIAGGTARITGRYTMEEARDLAIVLKAGALPAPVNVLEERTVGPSLGRDSIKAGFKSMIIGGLAVILFMLIYYKLGGLFADLTLILNIVCIMGCLAAFQAVLTLPGIAGLILTIGMAVDANVLVYERIREELRLGKTAAAAVQTGFSKATWTIMDANVTTLIAGLVLFQFGTGPVRGFAVTLSLGIVSTLFAALVFSRFLFDYLVTVRGAKKLSI